MSAVVDITVANHGTIVLVRPTTPAGEAWIDEYVDPAATWFGDQLVVEPRYVAPLVEGMFADGLAVAAA
jgi:hypothetical protein